jgi:inosose dehydratase
MIAANPIAYWAKAGKSKEAFAEAFRDYQRIGFSAVKADVPDGMSAADYRAWIGEFGLAPALSLFNSPFDETVAVAGEVEKAKRFAGVQVELGLDRTMVSSMSRPERMAEPAVGAGFDEGRLARAIDMCGEVCRALRAEGLWPLHHSHVGGIFETERECHRLLDDLGPAVIGAGPDTGHLTWAGVDPVDYIRRYADRVGALHVKDCFPDYLDPAARRGMSYAEVSDTRRLWAEPGLGVVDFDAVLAALPPAYDGGFMIEVDVPSVATRFESHRISYDWARAHLSEARP